MDHNHKPISLHIPTTSFTFANTWFLPDNNKVQLKYLPIALEKKNIILMTKMYPNISAHHFLKIDSFTISHSKEKKKIKELLCFGIHKRKAHYIQGIISSAI